MTVEPVPGSACEVMSDVPGRLRLRLRSVAGGPELERRLRAEPGVTECRWTPLTRSLVVTYPPDSATRMALMAVAAPETSAPPLAEAAPAPRSRRASALARAIARVAAEADATVAGLSRGMLDLRTGLPLVLGIWALRQIARGNARPIAWSTALWYAHALLRDYALPADGDGE